MIVPGDTLNQTGAVKDGVSEYNFQLKNPKSEKMKSYIAINGYKEDLSDKRLHHEIYLSDPRKCAPERIRTVIRHPIKSI